MADQDKNNAERREQRLLMFALGALIIAAAVMAIIGFLCLRKPTTYIEGQAEAASVKISGKLPGRVVEIFVCEGQMVKAGDTLVHIHSSVAEAKLQQAEALEGAAQATNRRVDIGTRPQIIQSARDVVAQANAARVLAEKTYNRLQKLYDEGVVSEQKRDEAKAAYEAAVAGESAAKSQLDLAIAGAQAEDKAASASMVEVARGGVNEVEALLEDQYLTAPCDGQIDQIYPAVGELVALGAPIMNLLRTDDKWVVFNVREEELNNLEIGKEITLKIPGLDMKEIQAEVFYIRDLGTYATWRATKATGQWDSRTFEVKARPKENLPKLRPGMTVLYK